MESKLLKRQLRRTLGVADEAALGQWLSGLGDDARGVQVLSLLELVDAAYRQSDRDLDLRTRSLEISSQELLEANERLQSEYRAVRNALRTLRTTAESLAGAHDAAFPLDESEDGALERITSLMATLVEARRRSEERLQEAVRGSSLALWDWDLDADRVSIDNPAGDESFAELVSDESGDPRAALARLVHPADLRALRARLVDHLRGRTRDVSVEVRLRGSEGARWIIVRGMVVAISPDGRPRRLAGTLRDISSRKARELDLLRAKTAAEAASRAKGDFLASVSHEIRTPMNGVIALTELLLESETADDKRHYLGVIRDSAGSLLAIINDILDFSKIEAGRLDVDPVEFSLRGLLDDTLGGLAVRADQKGLELACDLPDDLPDAWFGDPGRLRQVLVNLVGNAIKFTDAGEIEVGVAASAARPGREGLAFFVRDTGIGISPDMREHIFEAFTQVDSSARRRAGGTGLGLAICQRIVESMEGRIAVETAAGGGSIFRFSVALEPRPDPGQTACASKKLAARRVLVVDDSPLVRRLVAKALGAAGATVIESSDGPTALRALEAAPGIDAALVDARLGDEDGFAVATSLRSARADLPVVALLQASQLSQGTRRSEELGLAGAIPKPASGERVRQAVIRAIAPPPPLPAATPKTPEAPSPDAVPGRTGFRILLAEDNPINALVATKVLSGQGHQVTLAQSGRQAVDLWTRQPFDLVLMDMQMPELDGCEAARAIREREAQAGGRTPIIAVTANALPEDRECCLAAGMDGYLSKPFTPAELRRVLDALAATPPAA